MTIQGTHWNPLDQTSGQGGSLSNFNLTYTQGAAQGVTTFVRSLDLQVGGKYYIEIFINAIGGMTFSGFSLADASVALGSSQKLAISVNGSIFNNTGGPSTIQNITTGQTWGLAIDLAGNCWARTNLGNWNNSGTANPATGVGAITFAPLAKTKLMCDINNNSFGSIAQLTLNAGSSAFTNTPPSGFIAGWPSQASADGMLFNTLF